MNNLVKIRVNFKRENLIPGVNMSRLCDLLIERLSDETKKELSNIKNEDYSKVNFSLKR